MSASELPDNVSLMLITQYGSRPYNTVPPEFTRLVEHLHDLHGDVSVYADFTWFKWHIKQAMEIDYQPEETNIDIAIDIFRGIINANPYVNKLHSKDKAINLFVVGDFIEALSPDGEEVLRKVTVTV